MPLFKRLSPLLLLIFIDSLSFFLIIPILLQLFFKEDFGLLSPDTPMSTRNFLTGFSISLSTFAALICAPFISGLSDRFGRKRLLITCLLIMMLGFVLPIVGIARKSLLLILLGRMIGGIGSVSQPVAQAAVADLTEGKNRSLALSWIGLMMTLPLIVGPLIGAYFSSPKFLAFATITTPYYIAFGLGALNLILICFGFQESLSQEARQTPQTRISMSAKWQLIQDSKIGYLLLAFFLAEIAWSQYYQSIPLFLLHAAHYQPEQISQFNTYIGVLMTVSLLILYPKLNPHFSPLNLARYAGLLALLGFAISTLFAPFVLAQWLAVFFIALFVGITYVALLSQISQKLPSNQQGWLMGSTSTLLFLAWVSTGFASGWLISIHLNLPLYLAALASLGSLFCIIRPKEVEDKEWLSG